MISREDVWTDVRIGCSCYWRLQAVFFKRDKLRYDKISMSGGGSAKVHVQNRLYVPDPFVVRETRRSLFKVGMIFFALSLDGMKSRFWMNITFHWSESQVKNPIANFLFVLLKGMTSQTIGLNIGFMPFLLKPVTSCVLLHVSQTPTSVNTIVMLRAWGLWLVLTMLSYEASEEKLKADQSIFGMTDSWTKKKDPWLVFKSSLRIDMIQPVYWDGIEVLRVMKMSQ